MTNKRRRLSREQMQSTLLTVIDLLNHMKTKEEILEELRKEEYLKHVSIYDVEYYIKKARNLPYGLLKQSAFTPSQNAFALIQDIERTRKKQEALMDADESVDDNVKLAASRDYLKSSLQLAQIRNMVSKALKEEDNEGYKPVRRAVSNHQPELRSEHIQPSEIP